ncbi:MAG: hypothetical protein CMH46_12580 [Muricauda sp.]|nr:hypothetical protein [Allomuricauda sp.]|tara:strand:+ start:27865 stop:28056 length:192 start_codon:yes stop_codon:yes gene_type:complete
MHKLSWIYHKISEEGIHGFMINIMFFQQKDVMLKKIDELHHKFISQGKKAAIKSPPINQSNKN